MQAPPQKDFAAAFGALQSQYGLGGGISTPSLAQTDGNTRKWYKWGTSRSSSTASLIKPMTSAPSQPAMPTQATLSESELRLGMMMAEYGHGPLSHARLDHK